MRVKLGLAACAVVALAAASGMTWERAEAAKAPVAGKVTFYKGKVLRAASEKGPWTRLKRNRKFFRGDYIKTGDGSRVELKFTIEASSGSAPRPPSARGVLRQKGGAKKVSGVEGWGTGPTSISSSGVRTPSTCAATTPSPVSVAPSTAWIARRTAARRSPSSMAPWRWTTALGSRRCKRTKTPEGGASSHEPGTIAFGARKEVSLGIREISKSQWEQMVGKTR